MKTMEKKLYEAMFLVDTAEAAADWDGIIAVIKNIFERAGAEIVSLKKWDERRTAYEIKGKSRGTYILCYFNVEGEKVTNIERDVQLSEKIARVLILTADHMTEEDINKATPLERVESRAPEAAEDTAAKESLDEVETDESADIDVVEEPEAQELDMEETK